MTSAANCHLLPADTHNAEVISKILRFVFPMKVCREGAGGWAGAVKLISVVTFLANCLTLFVRCRVIMTGRAAAASYPSYPWCLANSRHTKPPKLVLTRQSKAGDCILG